MSLFNIEIRIKGNHSNMTNQQYSHLGLCIWDSSNDWCIVSIDDEYLAFFGKESFVNEAKKHLKKIDRSN